MANTQGTANSDDVLSKFGKGMLAGAIAGAAGKTATAPIDRIKMIYQVDPHKVFTFRDAFATSAEIVKRSGSAALWRGNGVALLRIIPYASINFYSFDKYAIWTSQVSKELFGTDVAHHVDRSSFKLSYFLAGSMAGITATLLTFPLDLIRARLAVHTDKAPKYSSLLQAVLRIWRQEGFAAFFRGLQPSLLGIVPYSGIGFGTFHTLKVLVAKKFYPEGMNAHSVEDEREQATQVLPMWVSGLVGGASGLLAQCATYPLHVLRRRMQVSESTEVARGVVGQLRNIYMREGLFRGLYKGFAMNFFKGPIAFGVAFMLNDYIKLLLQQEQPWGSPRKQDPLLPSRFGHHEAERSVLPATSTASDSTETTDNLLSLVQKFVAGGTAGAVAKTVIAPADRVKILYQVNPNRPFSLESAVRTGLRILDHTGIKGLWRGHCATLGRVVLSSGVSYTAFDYYSKMLLAAEWKYFRSGGGLDAPEKPLHSVATRFCSGAMAGATATCLTYPLDLLRARMASHWQLKPVYPSYAAALARIRQTEGVLSLWSGLRPTLLGIVPYAGLTFMTFETIKARGIRHFDVERSTDLPVFFRVMAGGVAGLIGQSATYPLDIVRRRMQVQGAGTHANGSTALPRYTSTWQALRQIAQTEGVIQGLYKGLSMNWLKGPIAVGVSFTVNDSLKQFIIGK